jgi:L-fuconolactonase
MIRIDAHQHFWTFSPEHYSWIDESMGALRRDFGPDDLRPELGLAGVEGTVLVEARGHLAETQNLLQLAAQADFVRGVVGWLPLTEPGVVGLLEEYASQAKLRGLRHWMGPESDVDYMFDPALQRGVGLLHTLGLHALGPTPRGLTYDLMLWPPQLARAAAFVDLHPKQVFILDHFAKPYIRDRKLEPWRTQLEELARRPNVYCKVSGLATEADMKHWTLTDLLPYLDTALEAFGAQRLMFGSDWPVCTLATSYTRWVEAIRSWLAPLSVSERDRILGGTAIEAYQL